MRDPDPKRLALALEKAANRLRAARGPEGFWLGRLSSSALSTATATSALSLAAKPEDLPLRERGALWLARHQNSDGGWGDTTDSPSNLSTTLLGLATLKMAGPAAGEESRAALDRADTWVTRRAGRTPAERRAALERLYGADRTFAVPILMNLAGAGLIPWEGLPNLPFELAAAPQRFYRALRLHVVSYALPALIGVGLILHRRAPPRCPFTRLLRRAVTPLVLRKLEALQPESGGYLEATPLTSFVAISLVQLYGPEQPVARRALEFLRRLARQDGSWPIDSNLSVWVTTGAAVALLKAGRFSPREAVETCGWLLAQQVRRVHVFTGAAPGAWGWSHLTGSVPDADDTSGALLALSLLREVPEVRARYDAELRRALQEGAGWLWDLRNADGGWPTFCRGWGRLPFDRSAADISAHALRALAVAAPERLAAERGRAEAYLRAAQRPEGAWMPLWFGNQAAARQENLVFGTARVLRALAETGMGEAYAERGARFLLETQNSDGGWGGAGGVASSVEETAVALMAMVAWRDRRSAGPGSAARAALEEAVGRGAECLLRRVEDDTWDRPAPIGLYFAILWYAEELYPLIWTVEALAMLSPRSGRAP